LEFQEPLTTSARGGCRLRLSGDTFMKTLLAKFVRGTEGQDLIEYALLAAVIAIGVSAAMGLVKTALNTEFSKVATSVSAN